MLTVPPIILSHSSSSWLAPLLASRFFSYCQRPILPGLLILFGCNGYQTSPSLFSRYVHT